MASKRKKLDGLGKVLVQGWPILILGALAAGVLAVVLAVMLEAAPDGWLKNLAPIWKNHRGSLIGLFVLVGVSSILPVAWAILKIITDWRNGKMEDVLGG